MSSCSDDAGESSWVVPCSRGGQDHDLGCSGVTSSLTELNYCEWQPKMVLVILFPVTIAKGWSPRAWEGIVINVSYMLSIFLTDPV